MLHESIATYLHPSILSSNPKIVEEYYNFQDELEDVIAKASVLPKMLGDYLLKDVRAKRARIEQQFKQSIQQAIDGKRLQQVSSLVLETTTYP